MCYLSLVFCFAVSWSAHVLPLCPRDILLFNLVKSLFLKFFLLSRHILYFYSTGSGLSAPHLKNTMQLPKPSQRLFSRLLYQKLIHKLRSHLSGHRAFSRGMGVTDNLILLITDVLKFVIDLPGQLEWIQCL